MPMNSAAPRRCRMRSSESVSRPSPLSTMKRMGCTVVSALISVVIGREQLTDTPSLTSAAARLRWAGVMKFTVPSWSSVPQRPQLESVSSILRTSSCVGIAVMLDMGAPTWPPNPHTLGPPRRSRGGPR